MTTTEPAARAPLKRDLLILTGLAALSLILGLGANALRSRPVSLHYSSKEERLMTEAQALRPSLPAEAELRYIRTAELIEAQQRERLVVLDARPRAFYELGHIPGALSLPREDFRQSYQEHQAVLEAAKGQSFVVYCQGADCEDSELVAKALRQMGFQNISVLMGGWEEWQNK